MTTLSPGAKLGPYEIISSIGAGGMGKVYRARDMRLGRDVAVKVLPEELARDAALMGRFEREAKVLASLNHPNIALIYGVEDSVEPPALVMELVEGPILSERIAGGAIPIEEALRIARQIAEALEYAHERNVIHRDLKPDNVKVNGDDNVKVLDFGLAKVVEADPVSSDKPSSTTNVLNTEAGTILGTAPYMSPEQAKGKAAGRRTDIWAFGCVLFEMLTGRRAFHGETIADTLAAILRQEPDWSLLPPATPAPIVDLLHRCLRKETAKRLQSIGDARIVIEEVLDGGVDERAVVESLSQPLPVRKRSIGMTALLPWALTVIFVLVLGWFLAFHRAAPPAASDLTAVLVSEPGVESPVISPDGRTVAFILQRRLWVRGINDLQPRMLESVDDAANPFWSTDSKSIGYFRNNAELRRVSVNSGVSNLICNLPSARSFLGATWGSTDRILFSVIPDGLFEVSAEGGRPMLFAKPDPAKDELFLREPYFLPDGKSVLMVVRRTGPGIKVDTIAVQSGEKRRAVLQVPGAEVHDVIASPATGHLLFEEDRPNFGVWAVPFSFRDLKTTGAPFLVRAHAAKPSVSRSGDLVYLSGMMPEEGQLAWVDRSGKLLRSFGRSMTDMRNPAISQDGARVAVAADRQKYDVWAVDPVRDTSTDLTWSLSNANSPAWFSSGQRIAFACQTSAVASEGICAAPADGSQPPVQLVGGVSPSGLSLAPDGNSALFAERNAQNNYDIWTVSFTQGTKSHPFLATPDNEFSPRISPDGRYVAYQSDESGRYEVYVRPYPSGSARWTISTNGGTTPRWNGTGTELFYLEGMNLMAVPVRVYPDFAPGIPQKLFSGQDVDSKMIKFDDSLYDAAPDGSRFVVVRSSQTGTPEIVAQQNWFAEFKKK